MKKSGTQDSQRRKLGEYVSAEEYIPILPSPLSILCFILRQRTTHARITWSGLLLSASCYHNQPCTQICVYKVLEGRRSGRRRALYWRL